VNVLRAYAVEITSGLDDWNRFPARAFPSAEATPPPVASRQPLTGLPGLRRPPAASFSAQTGQATNAVFDFRSILINMLRDEKPTHLEVAFDVSRVSLPGTGIARRGRCPAADDFTPVRPMTGRR
jgi:hypothetical protein